MSRYRKYTEEERRIEKDIIMAMKLLGAVGGKTKIVAEQTRTGAFIKDDNRFKGWGDHVWFYNFKMYVVEAKSKTGTQSDEQKNVEVLCKASGVEYILARSSGDVLIAMTGEHGIQKNEQWEKWKKENLK